MNKAFYKNAILWGFALWFIGYVLGIVLFFVVSPSMIGWILTPIGVLITLWVLFKKISASFEHYALLAVAWTLIAIVLDYIFLVMIFKPADGYYKLDVYLYYALTLILPLAVGWYKNRTQNMIDSGT
ncbi:MAG: hypothetical protein G01um10148_1043 [Parcubacteria group bacterium Gr01-1014_8]|nr:MAG: hypothetical protein G01um10148_1043 [Parcubacteria group bacterium Gr01-1014_8]